jgi:hypothetical protein
MSDVAYAVHTSTCTYLLDEDGVCRWVMSPTGTIPADGQRCVGAQFVACLDLRVVGGLVGELLLGASVLFVRRDEEAGRLVLLRTSPIENVEFRKPVEPAMHPAPLPAYADPDPPLDYARSHPAEPEAEVIDPDDLVAYEGGAVTLTIPLYRPGAQPSPERPSPHWRRVPAPPISDEALSRDRGSTRGRRR